MSYEREFATLSVSSMRLDALGAFKVTSDKTDGEYVAIPVELLVPVLQTI